VTEFSPGEALELTGPLAGKDLEQWLRERGRITDRPDAIRIDGRFESVHLRSVPKQEPPYPSLAEAISHQQVAELRDVAGTMVGFRFPDPLDGIELTGFHLHFVTDDRALGGHVLSYVALEGTVRIDEAGDLHVELPPAVAAPAHGTNLDQGEISRLESSS
jgi:acetolactate decarboxylase